MINKKGKIVAVLSDTAGICASCKQPIVGEKKIINNGYVEFYELNGKRYHKRCAGLTVAEDEGHPIDD